MRQDVYENLSLPQLEEHFDEIESSAYSVSLFTDWRSERVNQVWLKRRITDVDSSGLESGTGVVRSDAGAKTPAPHRQLSAEACTEQMGIPGPWYERLPHFRMDFTPSSGEELQTEYLVPRQHAITALRAIHRLRDRVAPLLQISEIRTIAEDDLWMSPCYGQACVGIHFTWKKNWGAVRQLLPAARRSTRAPKCASALGQAIYDAGRASAIPLSEAGRLSDDLCAPTIHRAYSVTPSWTGIFLERTDCPEFTQNPHQERLFPRFDTTPQAASG